MPSKSLTFIQLPHTIIFRIGIIAGIMMGISAVPSTPLASIKDTITDTIVTYVAVDRIYLSAGQNGDLRQGDEVILMRNNEPIATARITQLSNLSCAATIINKKRTVRIGDIGILPLVQKSPPKLPPPHQQSHRHRSHRNHVDWDRIQLSTQWRQSLANTPLDRVPYRSTQVIPKHALSTLAGGSALHQYSYFQSSRYVQTEQNIWFSAHAENQWLKGLSWTVNGAALARYDNKDDLYLPNRHFIPLMRDISVSYQPLRHPFSITFGRFSPDAPIVHTIDGMETQLHAKQISFSFFAGLQPDEQNLAFNRKRQTFGAASRYRPGNTEHGYFEAAVVAQMFNGRFYRTALGINSRYDNPEGLTITESAVLDFLSAQNTSNSSGNITLSNAAVNADWPLASKTQMDTSIRYRGNVLYTQDYANLSAQWLPSLQQETGMLSGEWGIPHTTRHQNTIRPYLFGRSNVRNSRFNSAIGGAGFSIHDDTLFGSKTGITTVTDYGTGTGQIANIDVTLNTPFRNHNLYLLSGLYTTWSWVYHSDVHTLRNIAFLMLQGHIHKNIDITANWNTGYDHALVRLTYPLGVWMQFQLGVTAYY